MRKRIPYNIYSIEDIDEWRKDFFYPLSSDVRYSVMKSICSALLEEFQALNSDREVYFRIASKALFLDSFDFLMKLITAHRMRSFSDVEFILTNYRCPHDVTLPERCVGHEIYRGSQDIVFPDLLLTRDDEVYRSIQSWKFIVRRMTNLLRQGMRPRGRINNSLMITPNQYSRKYLKNRYGELPFMIRPELLFRMDLSDQDGLDRKSTFQDISSHLALGMDQFFREIAGDNIPEGILNKYEDAVNGQFVRVACDLAQAKRFFSRWPSGLRLYTGTAKYYARIVSEAIREKGGTVTGFPHGGISSGLDLPLLSFTEFATCDRFVCFDERDVDDYSRYPKINEISFPVVKDLGESPLNISRSRFRSSETIDLSKVQTIMYLNYSYWYDTYAIGTRSDVQGLDLQLRVIDFLISLNRRIIFKLRPKTAMLSRAYKHFDYFGDKIEYTAIPFKEVMEVAELFVLEGLNSTALHEAMTLTDKPILFLKPPNPKCTVDYNEILRKRCYVVELKEDSRNRLCFDEVDLRRLFGS